MANIADGDGMAGTPLVFAMRSAENTQHGIEQERGGYWLDEHIAKMLDWDKPLSEQAQNIKNVLETAGIKTYDSTPGEHVYKRLAEKLGSKDAAAQFLREQGIPGIRYLDGGSRGAGGGTSNFVVFPGNEGLLSILERNGQPLR